MKDVLIAATHSKSLSFWTDVMDIASDLSCQSLLLQDDASVSTLLNTCPNSIVLIVSHDLNDSDLDVANETQLLLDFFRYIQLLVEKQLAIVINRKLALRLNLSTASLNRLGIHAIVDENMPIVNISNIFNMVREGGYYLEPLTPHENSSSFK